jgi:hypothetical protein
MPSLKSLFFPAMLILASPLAVQGQIEDLTRDMDFFQNQKAALRRFAAAAWAFAWLGPFS